MRQLSLLALGLLVAGCAPKTEAPAAAPASAAQPAALSAADLDAVKAVDVAFAAAMNAKDTAAVFASYTDDAKLMPPDAPIMDMAAARPVLAGLVASGVTDFVLTPSVVYGVGDLAYMVGTATFTEGGVSQSIKYTEVLRKGADGKWRYVVDMFSSMAPAPSSPATPAK
ncbi:MAG TPA: DUF4440 domain-containing protein [Gemmatimonas sp.]|nr:DUF4440 domain-containing protein [Gemmatimonas sp.]